MAALPYMPLFVADYLADTPHLTATQHGAYMLLLMNYWQRGGPLPDDDARLARIARVGHREWARMRDVISEFFTPTHGAWVSERMDKELARVSAKSLKCQEAGRTSAQRRLNNRSTDAEPTDTHTDKKVPLDKSNGAEADSDKRFWEAAKGFLEPESKNPGALIGKWRRDHGLEATANALTRAQLERPVQRIPFIEACLRKVRAQPAVPL